MYLLHAQVGSSTPHMGQNEPEQSVVAVKNVIFKAFAGPPRKSFWCGDVYNIPSYRGNDEERLERL